MRPHIHSHTTDARARTDAHTYEKLTVSGTGTDSATRVRKIQVGVGRERKLVETEGGRRVGEGGNQTCDFIDAALQGTSQAVAVPIYT